MIFPRCYLILILFLPVCAHAKDLGIYGECTYIIEEDFLLYLQNKLKLIGNKKLEEHQQKITTKVIQKIKRPKPVVGISYAHQTQTRLFDPTFEVKENIIDTKGNLIHPKGKRINPLEIVPFTEQWIFIDGDNDPQVSFAKKYLKDNLNTKIILLKGTPGEQSDGTFFYFDQFGELTKKLSINKIPTIVKQAKDQNLIEIKEVSNNEINH